MNLPNTDLTNHRIQGYTNQGGHRIDLPLITHIEGNLWVGGCVGGVQLPEDFVHVVSLYPWQQYALGAKTGRVEVEMYDSLDQTLEAVDEVAAQVVDYLKEGKTLVHCQAGLNRSNLIAGRALMLMGRSSSDAIALLRKQRDKAVLCNHAFEAHLRSLDREDAA